MAEPSSSRMSKARSKIRRASMVASASQTLRETLSAFGDDVVRIKDPHQLPSLSSLGEHSNNFNGINPSGLDFTSHGQDSDLMSSQQQMKFERIPSSEVGVRSSRWRKALVAGLFSSKLSSSKSPQEGSADGHLRNDEDQQGLGAPPFWGVGDDKRAKVSTLTLQLVLHEIACFASCVLLGCLVVQGLEGISWIKSPEMKSHWLFSRLYGSFSTALLVFTSIGFLIRIDTTDKSSLLTMPLILIPTVLLSSSEYLNKSWELQRQECLNYLKMDESSRNHVHLTQDCDSYEHKNLTVVDSYPDVSLILMRICPVIVCFGISLYLFIARTSFYMISRFRNQS